MVGNNTFQYYQPKRNKTACKLAQWRVLENSKICLMFCTIWISLNIRVYMALFWEFAFEEEKHITARMNEFKVHIKVYERKGH